LSELPARFQIVTNPLGVRVDVSTTEASGRLWRSEGGTPDTGALDRHLPRSAPATHPTQTDGFWPVLATRLASMEFVRGSLSAISRKALSERETTYQCDIL
jgi:hypothetical protein